MNALPKGRKGRFTSSPNFFRKPTKNHLLSVLIFGILLIVAFGKPVSKAVTITDMRK